MARIEALLFDIGNVLIGVDFALVAKSWGKASGCDPQELLSRFEPGSDYEAHERGEIDWTTYGRRITETLTITLSDEELLAGWNAVFTGPMPGIEALLARLPSDLPVYAFSNTNAAHQAYFIKHHGHLFDGFHTVFCSHEIGMRKPEARAFAHVVTAIGGPAESILFFDDSSLNIEAALQSGLAAHHSTNTSELREGLRNHRVI